MTAELALALPTLMLILAVGIWMQSAVALQARCQDAARAGARAAARGDPDAAIRSALSAALPAGANVGISRAGSQVTVTVQRFRAGARRAVGPRLGAVRHVVPPRPQDEDP